jgi:drug/metabolite transporter (DMT)-like permease
MTTGETLLFGFRNFASFITVFCMMTSLHLLPISTTFTIFNTHPYFGIILALVFLGEKVKVYEIVCVTAVFSGIAMIYQGRS